MVVWDFVDKSSNLEFFGQGKNWRGFCNFVPEFLIDAWTGMAKLPLRFNHFIGKG
jgi:hypothetical protein